jgi:hypothetical protein
MSVSSSQDKHASIAIELTPSQIDRVVRDAVGADASSRKYRLAR